MLVGSATSDGYALTKAFDRKVAKAGEACRQQDITFIPLAMDTFGGVHKVMIEQVQKLGSTLAQHRGEEEQLETRHLFQRLSLLLMRGTAALLVNRVPEGDTLEP